MQSKNISEREIGKHGHVYETTPEPSTRGIVGIT
jgi:hypothetical protein